MVLLVDKEIVNSKTASLRTLLLILQVHKMLSRYFVYDKKILLHCRILNQPLEHYLDQTRLQHIAIRTCIQHPVTAKTNLRTAWQLQFLLRCAVIDNLMQIPMHFYLANSPSWHSLAFTCAGNSPSWHSLALTCAAENFSNVYCPFSYVSKLSPSSRNRWPLAERDSSIATSSRNGFLRLDRREIWKRKALNFKN